ncbi:MAG: histidine utilization repressor [Sinobacteraceae bacterium]|nr:histidine utilization repressor [Nevskiaceae bacterium]MCP5340037.1 histidine utilization repressor [Nevskiaceae bacterium]MCP5359261.1 histidine utilization repressor [Nevskiaceae bacterium]MCP5466490.1 histidine utilization repressor [Nevskiaceae bacterium]MCP5471803.1 histidine utilization repressor [Nevskiaceae bacterium]
MNSTLHLRIRSNIQKQILSGSWPPGYRIPFEHELVARYRCSRMTVNKAIASLVSAGLIVRRRRAGSFVAEPRVQSAVLEIPDIRAKIEERGQTYSLQLLSRRRRKPAGRREYERTLAAGGDLLAVRCLHLANGRPYALEERLISLVAVPEAASIDFSLEPPGSWLLRHIPWTEAEHRIRAIDASEEEADLLELSSHRACLELSRRTLRGPEHITRVRLLFPGSGFDLVAHFAPLGK